MKIIIKILIAYLTSFFLFSSAINADESYFTKLQTSKVNIEFSTIEGVNLKDVFKDELEFNEFIFGRNFGDAFVEIGYGVTETGRKNLVNFSSNSITFNLDSLIKLRSKKIGLGYNYDLGDKMKLTPVINYRHIEYDASFETGFSIVGSGTFAGSATTTESESAFDVGVGFTYGITENSNLGITYSTTLYDNISDTESMSMFGLTFELRH
ncbi:hypothetical protein N8731_02125 [Pelagibacteraceae bacterium]|nr:hypothetical protein [Pelagibacteraceae bacterium]